MPFIDYLQTINVYENLEGCNPTKKLVFDDIIADMKTNNRLSHIVIELFLRARKLKISLVFISKSKVKVKIKSPKNYKTKCNTLFYHENS